MRRLFPDGIRPEHRQPGRWDGAASPLTFLLLAGAMLLALSGQLGGNAPRVQVVHLGAADLVVHDPRVLRNGEFFELRVAVTARRGLADMVVALDPAQWRDVTINTMVPAADKEDFAGGAIRLHYGPLEGGERRDVKIDGQLNPAHIGEAVGPIGLYDDERFLGAIDAPIRVMP
ncbi:hypothetical protein [Sphingopyxis terrae]|uniref:Uncharacterized protein n=1 Tax=Sphingopyxis terrae subsp. ummariensis TaxID=429001 RepID=A0A1Y6FUG6_9SPHN|nr:hypothetical protein [Sphingopyxis terrae]PCF91338.1 hypothetical protein CPA46_07725 [Sphingopyxis terrae subsp. ummariensis]SMQ76512.1 hypothetical protein SAMN06295984_1953 [Sphingopyxis terrae subsp. ummariensis]